MASKEIEITATMSQTIQERQFEPVQFSATAKTICDSENMMSELDHLYDELEEAISQRFKSRRMMK